MPPFLSVSTIVNWTNFSFPLLEESLISKLIVGQINQMKIFKFLFVIPVITLIIIFQTSLQNRYLMASDIRDGETIFRNVCAGCHVRGGSVVLKGSKSLKLSDLEKRGIADVNSITIIANDGIGFMKGYKNKLKDGEDKVLAQWIIQNAEKGWE